jgi:hypothetical protein
MYYCCLLFINDKLKKMDLRNLQFIFKPQYWLMNYPYNVEVDKIVNELLDNHELSDLSPSQCTAKLGKATIWVENRPYASGRLCGTHARLCGTQLEHYRPSRLTIKRLLKKFYELRDSVTKENVRQVRNEVL